MQKQIQKVPPCIWKYTRRFGFSHTCVVFAKRLEKPQVFGKNHTCKVFTKHFLRLKSCYFQYLAEVGKAAMLKEKVNL